MQLFAGMTESVGTKLGYVAERAKRDKSVVFDRIMHHINEESLKASFQQLRKECAVGVDGISWEEYGKRLEENIKGFFDNVEHGKLVEWLQSRIRDGYFIRYVVRFLKSGYMEEEAFKETERGMPQGGNISPMLANVFLHYVVDEWFAKEVRPRMKGQGYVVRYCDDFVILVQYKDEAEMILKELKQRLKENGLEANAEKTHAISFGRYEKENAQRTGRRANTFDFLGITHYIGTSRWGKFKVGRKTSKKRFRRSCVAMNRWLSSMRNALPLKELWGQLKAKMSGHYAYYGISDNSRSLNEYYWKVIRMIFKWINRRSQRTSMNWSKFTAYLKRFPLPKPRIVHRFYVCSV